MKTLDEVIEKIEKMFVCPSSDEDAEYCDFMEVKEDALHYLKELRDMTDIPMEYFENGGTSQELRNTSQITCPKCHSEFVILDDPDGDHQQLQKCRALLQDFYRNDPLTWDELKQMEGKPVWVETKNNGNHWYVIDCVDANIMLCCGRFGERLKYFRDCMEVNLWQAYRKER